MLLYIDSRHHHCRHILVLSKSKNRVWHESLYIVKNTVLFSYFRYNIKIIQCIEFLLRSWKKSTYYSTNIKTAGSPCWYFRDNCSTRWFTWINNTVNSQYQFKISLLLLIYLIESSHYHSTTNNTRVHSKISIIFFLLFRYWFSLTFIHTHKHSNTKRETGRDRERKKYCR